MFVNHLWVTVLLLAASVLEVTESKLGCFTSMESCQNAALVGLRYVESCHHLCKLLGKRSIFCHRLGSRCYGCQCYASNFRNLHPKPPKRTLERHPWVHIYYLLKKYIDKQ